MVARLFGQDRREASDNALATLERLGLDQDGDRLVRTYSGGMRRRLDLGASLVGSPRLLLLDEPTTGLDPRSRVELWDGIRAMVERGTDVLLTTQYLDEADHLAGRVVIIDHGRAVADGTPNELKRRVGRNVVEVHVREPEEVPTVANVLARLGEGEPEIDESTRRIGVRVGAGTDELRAALGALESVGVTPDDVALRPPTLDEVFLELTGRPAEAMNEEAA
jgi:ABC-2 type transport system ATP-binding protein